MDATDRLLDEISISSEEEQDQLLDDLADDMLNEIDTKEAPAKAPVKPTTKPAAVATRAPAQQQMPDFASMMQQMMPMMNQFMGQNANSHQRQQRSAEKPWKDVIKEKVPRNEQQEWIKKIEADVKRQKTIKQFPSSRAYRLKPHGQQTKEKDSVIEPNAVLVELLRSAIRYAKCKPQPDKQEQWKTLDDKAIIDQFKNNGIASLFVQQELIPLLRSRTQSDPDFASDKFTAAKQVL